jgi:hypothetical protein
MTIDYDQILIFKTNIHTENDKANVSTTLNSNMQIRDWNIDLDDIDRVLRIESETLSHQQIIADLNALGYECAELT